MRPMAATASVAMPPPPSADLRASSASELACWAFSALCLIVVESWRIAEAISSRLATCSSVRDDRSWEPPASCCVAERIASTPLAVCPTVSASFTAVLLQSSLSRARSP